MPEGDTSSGGGLQLVGMGNTIRYHSLDVRVIENHWVCWIIDRFVCQINQFLQCEV